MAKKKVIYKSIEQIRAVSPYDKDWIEYRGALQVFDSGAFPVLLELTFVPPYHFTQEVPETHSIKAKSLTEVYVKLSRFLKKHGFQFDG